MIVALNVAVDDRIIPYNPVATVKKLKVQRQEVVPLTSSEVAAIRWSVEGHRLEALYHLERMEQVYLGEQYEADEAQIKHRAWQRTSGAPHKERKEG